MPHFGWFYTFVPVFVLFAFGFGIFASLGGYFHTGVLAQLSFAGALLCAAIVTVIHWRVNRFE